jgi:hypothetical protein
MYWWVWTTREGKPVIFAPPYNSEEEASEYGFQKLGSNFEVTQLNTRDIAKATRSIKRGIFEKTSNLDIALQRAKHNLLEETEQ